MDARGTPSTPSEGTAIDVDIVLSEGKRLVLKDIPYSKHLGAYLVTVAGVRGMVQVTVKATRGNVAKTRTEQFKFK